jgi:hypothetical protein
MRFAANKLLSFGCFLAALLFLAEISAQNGTTVGAVSTGQIEMALEITNRPNPTLTLINKEGGGSESIPAFLAETLSKALGEKRNATFPVCLGGTSNGEVTVSVESQDGGRLLLTSDTGAQIPYDVSIKGKTNSANTRKAQYKQTEGAICDESSALQVEITIPGNLPPESTSQLRGRFRLTVTNE